MRKPLLETVTEKRLKSIIKDPPHALLITGPAGMGKNTVAEWLVSELRVGAHLLRIEPEKGKTSIGVEVVRQLEHFVSLKVAGSSAIDRAILICDAHLLSLEAQNALLKTLEEPPTGTVLILTSSEQGLLLPTILSRVQVLELRKPAIEQLSEALKQAGASETASILALSGGLPGLAFALNENNDSHALVAAAQTARQMLQISSFEKLTLVDALSKDKQKTADTLYILMQMAHAALQTGKSAERWQKVLRNAYDTRSDINNGAQPKLALTKLMLSL